MPEGTGDVAGPAPAARSPAEGASDIERMTFVPTAPTLSGAPNRTGGARPPGTQVETAEALVPVHVVHNGQGDPNTATDVAFALDTEAPSAVLPFDTTQVTSHLNRSQPKPGDPCHPLAAGAHPPAVAYGVRSGHQAATGSNVWEEGTGALEGAGSPWPSPSPRTSATSCVSRTTPSS